MVKLVEYRFPLPLSFDEYKRGQVYITAKLAEKDARAGNGGEGVEFIKNEKYEENGRSGRYTEKLIRVGSKIPSWVSYFIPAEKMLVTERSWDLFPYCRTEYESHMFSKEKFFLSIESVYKPDAGTSENALELEGRRLKRDIHLVEILNNEKEPYLSNFVFKEGDIDCTSEDWAQKAKNIICAYKLVTVKFSIPLIQGKIEHILQRKAFLDIFENGHREVMASISEWYNMTMEEVMQFEKSQADIINKIISNGIDEGEEHKKYIDGEAHNDHSGVASEDESISTEEEDSEGDSGFVSVDEDSDDGTGSISSESDGVSNDISEESEGDSGHGSDDSDDESESSSNVSDDDFEDFE